MSLPPGLGHTDSATIFSRLPRFLLPCPQISDGRRNYRLPQSQSERHLLCFRPWPEPRRKNRISRKHVDFLLCDSQTMRPRVGVELDDSSHAREDRQTRDALVQQVFDAAGLALLRFRAAGL